MLEVQALNASHAQHAVDGQAPDGQTHVAPATGTTDTEVFP